MKQYSGIRATEQTLMKIWADVLKLDRVGLNDNFFDLGGDSILGTLILARAAQAGVMISPRQLFEHQTIAELSNAIR
jgi:acyl carrier protein